MCSIWLNTLIFTFLTPFLPFIHYWFNDFFSHITNYTAFNFKKKFNQDDTEITIVDNGKKEVYNSDAYVKFDLSTKISFIIMLHKRSDYQIFAFCDDVTVTEIE